MKKINQLRGQVSASFIRQSRDEKYKQKTRVDNARKQQKRNLELDEKLVTVTSLNQEDDENKKKIIVVDGGGCQTLVQDCEKIADDEANSISNESSITNDEYKGANSPIIQIQEQQQTPKTQDAHFELETANPNSKGQHFDIVGPDNIPEHSGQKIESNNTVSAALINHNKSNNY